MPKDKAGAFHLNTQRAHASDRMKEAKPMEPPKGPPKAAGSAMVDHQNPMGEQHIGHHLMATAAEQEPDGKHMHVHQDGMGNITSHHVGEDGQVQGPHQHQDIEALKDHMHKFFNEEQQEGEGYGGHGGGGMDHEGLSGI